MLSRNRDTVHEFEIELSLNQIEKVVDDGIYIKVKVFIREASSYYVYHKDDAGKNHYMKGRTLISQFSSENKTILFHRKTTVEMIKEKIEVYLIWTRSISLILQLKMLLYMN